MKVTIYSTNCPQCKALEMLLRKKNIEPEIVYGTDYIVRMGYRTAPLMEIDGAIMTYPQAIQWINGYTPEEKSTCESCEVKDGESDVV